MKMILYIVGIIVALAGVVGFFSNPIIGIVETNAIQNIVYIILGLMTIMSAKKGHIMITKIVGIIFAILGILGLVLSGDTVIGLVQNTSTGNYFHLIIGIILIIIAFRNKGIPSGNESYSAPAQPQAPQMSQQPDDSQI